MKVSINLRIRTSDGRQPYCQPVWEGIRIKKLKPGWAIVNGVEEHHPEGVYHLSFYVGGLPHRSMGCWNAQRQVRLGEEDYGCD